MENTPAALAAQTTPTPTVTPVVVDAPPHKFVISTATCSVIQLRAMCDSLSLDNSGNFTVLKDRILAAVKDKELSPAELYKIPQMKPAFTRKLQKDKKRIARAKTGPTATALSAEGADVTMIDIPNARTLVTHVPAPLDKLDVRGQPTPTADPLMLNPENVTLQSLAVAFNESLRRQRDSDAVLSDVIGRQNDVIDVVNEMGNALHPLIKDTQELRSTMRLVKAAVQGLDEEREKDRDMIKAVMADCEQTTADLLQVFNDKAAASDVCDKQTDILIDDIRERLSETMDTSKTLETKTEWLDRNQRAQNMIIFGWDAVLSPLEDARRYFTKIGFTLAESFLAHRNPPTIKDGVVRAGILKVTFNSVPTCYRALEASRAHCKGNRQIAYYAKPDKTKEQEKYKRIADDGVRILRERHPGRDFRERSGKIAEFSTNNPDGRSSFVGWVPIPTEHEDVMVD